MRFRLLGQLSRKLPLEWDARVRSISVNFTDLDCSNFGGNKFEERKKRCRATVYRFTLIYPHLHDKNGSLLTPGYYCKLRTPEKSDSSANRIHNPVRFATLEQPATEQCGHVKLFRLWFAFFFSRRAGGSTYIRCSSRDIAFKQSSSTSRCFKLVTSIRTSHIEYPEQSFQVGVGKPPA